MPSPEPNKEIDELLRAYAKKRREQQPPELHPASRKMLQDTVRQTFGTASQKPARTPAWIWMRYVLGGSLAVAFVVVSLLVVRKSPKNANLDNAGKQLSDEAPVAHFAPAPTVAAAPPATASEPPVAPAPVVVASPPPLSVPVDPAAQKQDAAKSALSPVNSPSFGGGGAGASQDYVTGEVATRAHRVSAAVASAPAGAAQPELVAAQNTAVSGYFKNTGQQYVQMNNLAANKKQPDTLANVLSNFQMERQGGNVVVYDSDGSTYKGKVLDSADNDKLVRPQDRQTIFGQSAVTATAVGNESNYAFEVYGINNASQKSITFTGNVVGAPTEGIVPAAGSVLASNQSLNSSAGLLKTDSVALKAQSQASLQNSMQNANQSQQFPRVTGKLKVDGGVYDIEAQPPLQQNN